VSEVGDVVGLVRGREFHTEERALEAVFESLGRACVQSLVAAPHPFGLRPCDREVARRWLSRGGWSRQWQRDLVIVLAVVGLGLAIAFIVLGVQRSAGPVSDAVQRPARVLAPHA
jgi:hypothetical protein